MRFSISTPAKYKMSNLADQTTLRARFFELWPSDVPVVLDNAPNTIEPKVTWARLSIQPGASLPRSIATRTYLQLGRTYLQIFVLAELGTNPGWELAETFTTIFRDWCQGELRCFTPEFRVSTDEPAYFTLICSIPYESVHV